MVRRLLVVPTLLILALSTPALGQSTPPVPESDPAAFGEEILAHFQGSMDKVIALAEAMPAEAYTWAPAPGVMPVGQVYMHIARYNYMYPETSLGVPAPEGLDLASLEAERDKGRVLEVLRDSYDHVTQATAEMSGPDLATETTLYGRSVARWAVLLQLVAHMNEHLGQSIAYARMNDVVPPWSR